MHLPLTSLYIFTLDGITGQHPNLCRQHSSTRLVQAIQRHRSIRYWVTPTRNLSDNLLASHSPTHWYSWRQIQRHDVRRLQDCPPILTDIPPSFPNLLTIDQALGLLSLPFKYGQNITNVLHTNTRLRFLLYHLPEVHLRLVTATKILQLDAYLPRPKRNQVPHPFPPYLCQARPRHNLIYRRRSSKNIFIKKYLHSIGQIFASMGWVVPAPDGTIYLVDINETHYWGSK